MNLTYNTDPNFGYAVKFSPFSPNKIIAVASSNYGITGKGCLYLAEFDQSSIISKKIWEWKDTLFDVTWCEQDCDLVITASGDGHILLWNIGDTFTGNQPAHMIKAHTKEVHNVHWSEERTNQMLVSCSWDKSIKVWDIDHISQHYVELLGHTDLVYCVKWAPLIPGVVASTSGDGFLRLWDIRKNNHHTLSICADNHDVLACSWSYFDFNILWTGGSDCALKCWDLRNCKTSLIQFLGHNYPVRNIKCSPFDRNIIASCSYDKTVRIWDSLNERNPIKTSANHSQFVMGLDFNSFTKNQIADCSWDKTIHIWSEF